MNHSFAFFKKAFAFVVLMLAILFANTQANAEVTFDPHTLEFGAVLQGVQLCKTVVITNTFDGAITITGWSLHNQSTELSLGTFSQNVQLAKGESVSVQICYTPDGSLEAFQNSLIVFYTSAGHDSSTHSVHHSFTGSLDHHHDADTTHHTTDTNHVGHHCISLHHGAGSIDPIVIGATAEHILYLINPSNVDVTITAATISGTQAGAFTITSTLPITVPANSTTTTLSYNFSPDSSGHHTFSADLTLTLSGDSLTCQTIAGNLIGYPVVQHNPSGHNADTVLHPLFPSERRTLGIEGNGNHTSMTFYFTNNLDVDVTVNNVFLDDATYFTIASTTPSTAPFVLNPGGKLTVVVTYTATDKEVHYAHLVISADHQLQSTSFDLQGVQLQTASVSNVLPSDVAISVSPSPGKEYVTVDMKGIRSADVEVIDLLGKTVVSVKTNSIWKWDASNILSGYYIVRIAGVSMNGEPFVISKRIVLRK